MMCYGCRYTQVMVKQGQRDKTKNSIRILFEVRTGLPHDCDFSDPKYCKCGSMIYFDNKILSATGRKIPLNYDQDTYHYCDYPKGKGAVKA